MKKLLFLFLILGILMASCVPESQSQVALTVDEDQKQVRITIDGELFTAYRFESSLEKPVLYPVNAPGGTTVTRGFPIEPREKERVDHPHHVGFWFNFGDVNGFDFWNNSFAVSGEQKVHYGRILHREILRADVKNGKGFLEVKMDWVAPDTDQAEKLLEEHTTFVFQGSGLVRTIDRITRLTAVSDKVVLTDNKEGLLAIRVDRAFEHLSDKPVVYTDASGKSTEVPELDNEGVTGWYRNSEGNEGPDAWGKKAEWVKLTGTKEGVICSIVLLDHPRNPNYPSCWHARGYGLFSVNNMGSKVFNTDLQPFELVLKKGESVTLQHRLVVASKDLSDQEIREIQTGFTQD